MHATWRRFRLGALLGSHESGGEGEPPVAPELPPIETESGPPLPPPVPPPIDEPDPGAPPVEPPLTPIPSDPPPDAPATIPEVVSPPADPEQPPIAVAPSHYVISQLDSAIATALNGDKATHE